ncbi:hypothetical protein JTB14_011259 [Gonioctena quinquepunctata]|nr:hypothetical protein JTB14_011259 [Gonioctena quinquepunctata]
MAKGRWPGDECFHGICKSIRRYGTLEIKKKTYRISGHPPTKPSSLPPLGSPQNDRCDKEGKYAADDNATERHPVIILNRESPQGKVVRRRCDKKRKYAADDNANGNWCPVIILIQEKSTETIILVVDKIMRQ